MATIETEIRHCRLFIGGEWVEADAGEMFDDFDPFTGDVVARVAANLPESMHLIVIG